MRNSGLPALVLLLAVARAMAAETAAPTDQAAFSGSDACLACHEDQAKNLIHHGLGGEDPQCESCHGPGQAHVEAGGDVAKIQQLGKLPAQERSAACLNCHSTQGMTHWDGGIHAQNDVSCTDCHAVHREKGATPHLLARESVFDTCIRCHPMARVQTMRSSHMPIREGKMTCTDCHSPHGSTSEAMLVDPSVNDNCYRCHAEKRGPVLFEHPPVRESCLNCHNPHGSLHDNLLIANQPRLCQNCHINSRHPSDPREPNSRFLFGQSCLQCHSQVHGSNSPSGVRNER